MQKPKARLYKTKRCDQNINQPTTNVRKTNSSIIPLNYSNLCLLLPQSLSLVQWCPVAFLHWQEESCFSQSAKTHSWAEDELPPLPRWVLDHTSPHSNPSLSNLSPPSELIHPSSLSEWWTLLCFKYLLNLYTTLLSFDFSCFLFHNTWYLVNEASCYSDIAGDTQGEKKQVVCFWHFCRKGSKMTSL